MKFATKEEVDAQETNPTRDVTVPVEFSNAAAYRAKLIALLVGSFSAFLLPLLTNMSSSVFFFRVFEHPAV